MTLGGLLRKTGFRWVFPIGTMPIPYHPLIALLMMVGPIAWIGWLGVSAVVEMDGLPRWWQPLMVGLLLGIPLSVPIVAWAMFAIRAPLAQGILFAGSMLLLTVEIATGRTSPWLAILPAAFVLLYAVQRIGGKAMLARLRTEAEQWSPVDPGDATVVVTDEKHSGEKARNLLKRCDIARIASVPGSPLRGMREAQQLMLHRLSLATAQRLDAILTAHMPPDCNRGDMMADGWSIPAPDAAEPVLVRPVGDDAAVGLTVDIRPYRSPLWMVRGKLRRLRVHGAHMNRQLVCGVAHIAGPLPIFTFFHWTAIFGGQSEWCVGFLRERPVRLGPEAYNDYQLLPHAFVARPDEGGRTDESLFAGKAHDPAATAKPSVADMLTAFSASRRHDIVEWRWLTLAREGTGLDKASFERLNDPERERSLDDARLLLKELNEAKVGRRGYEARILAAMIAALPDTLFAAIRPELADVLNSRILAGKWLITPDIDRKSLPRDCPRLGDYGGFGLIGSVPRLYERFAALGPDEADFIDRLRQSLPPEASVPASAIGTYSRLDGALHPRDPTSPRPMTMHVKRRR